MIEIKPKNFDALVAKYAKPSFDTTARNIPLSIWEMQFREFYREASESSSIALSKINDIRNSIIGFQKMNWSEHIYPLVAALEEAGIEGAGYPASRANVGTMLERTLAAEALVEAKDAEIARLRGDLEMIRDGYGANHTSQFCRTIASGSLIKGEACGA